MRNERLHDIDNGEVIIQLENVTKKFNKKPLLTDINLTIDKGQSIALTGNNGVGKSTLLKIIANLSSIQNGKVTYTRKLLFNYIHEHFPRTNLTIVQYLSLMARIDEINKKDIQKIINTYLKEFYMEHMSDTPLLYLSKGSLQKVSVIQSLLVMPDVLLLDEPLSGLDIKSQRVFIKKMKELKTFGVTIIMSCHEKYLMNEISDVVVEIQNGQIETTVHKKDEVGTIFILTFIDEVGGLTLPPLAFPIDETENKVGVYVDEDRTNEVVSLMISQGWSLRGMHHE